MDCNKVLLLSANPANTDRLRVEAEFREIEECWQKSSQRDRYAIVTKGAVRIDDLQPILLQEVPRVVHFSGHGAAANGLVLEHDDGTWQLAPTEALADLFRILQNGIDCVVLNACFSSVQAEAIARYVPYVLGMNQAIGDRAAIEFAKGFYGALFEGRSVKDAFELGKNLIALKNIPEAQTPVLITRTAARNAVSNAANNAANNNDVNLVQMDGRWYVVQTQIENRCREELLKPGALIRIKSPSKMGKGMLKARLLEFAQSQGYRTVTVDLREANQETFGHINQFLQWLCAYVADSLEIEANPEENWKKILGASTNCTKYMEKFLLDADESPLVIAITNFDYVFNYPHVENDFLGLLRGWFEKVNVKKVWGKLRQIIVFSEEALVTHDINQSPFNVGLSIELDELTPEQVLVLANAYALQWSMSEVERLVSMIGGHPFLVHGALEHLRYHNHDLQTLLETAASDEGIYKSYLHELWRQLEADPELVAAMRKVAIADGAVRLERRELVKLDSMGLLKYKGADSLPRCELYKIYFGDRLQ